MALAKAICDFGGHQLYRFSMELRHIAKRQAVKITVGEQIYGLVGHSPRRESTCEAYMAETQAAKIIILRRIHEYEGHSSIESRCKEGIYEHTRRERSRILTEMEAERTLSQQAHLRVDGIDFAFISSQAHLNLHWREFSLLCLH
jgi:hypothetical protein